MYPQATTDELPTDYKSIFGNYYENEEFHRFSAEGAKRRRRLGTSLITDTPPPSSPPDFVGDSNASAPPRPGRAFGPQEDKFTADCAGGRVRKPRQGYWPRRVTRAEVEVSKQALAMARRASDRRNQVAEDKRQDRRAGRYRLRNVAAGILGSDFKIVTCGQYGIGFGHGIELRLEGQQAYYAGVSTCGSFSACPVCASKIAMKRQGVNAELLGKLVAMTDEAGNPRFSIVFVTHTVRHRATEKFDDVFDDLRGLYRSVYSGSPWAKARKRYGFVGGFRVIETTWGERSGWHVHSHAVLVVENSQASEAPEKMVSWLEGRWYDHSRKYKGRNVSFEHGTRGEVICLSPEDMADPKKKAGKIKEAETVASYLAKVSEVQASGLEASQESPLSKEEVLEITRETGRDLAMEALTGHLKKGRMKNLTPFQMLAEIASFKEVDALGRVASMKERKRDLKLRKLFREYAEGAKNKRFYQTLGEYKALLKLAGLSEEEADKTDEELAASEGGGGGVLLATIPNELWGKVAHWEVAPRILSMAENVENNPYVLYGALSSLGLEDGHMAGLIGLCKKKNAEEWASLSPEEKARELEQAEGRESLLF